MMLAADVMGAGFDGWPVSGDRYLCAGGREPLVSGSTAWADARGWLWCLGHASAQVMAEAEEAAYAIGAARHGAWRDSYLYGKRDGAGCTAWAPRGGNAEAYASGYQWGQRHQEAGRTG
jgi:hypothetical protein